MRDGYLAMKKCTVKNRSLRYLIALALALSALTATPAQAAIVSFACPTGGGTYQVNNGTLTGTTGTCTGDLVLDNSVTGIAYVSLIYTQITSLTIPASVVSVSNPFYYNSELVSVNVDSTSTSFKSIDGVLFNFAETLLIAYPAAKPGTTYTIPSSVTSIAGIAFSANKYLTSISIPNGVTSTGGGVFIGAEAITTVNVGTGLINLTERTFAYMYSLTSISVDPANTGLISIDGVLYTRDMSTLLAYPPNKAGTSFTPPSSVTSTANAVFGDARRLLSVDLSSITTMLGAEFYRSNSIQEVTFGNSLTGLSSEIFGFAPSLRRLNFGSGLTTIPANAFNSNTSFSCVVYTGTNSTIQNYAYPNGVSPVASGASCLSAPAFTLSSSNEVVNVGSAINGYTINSTGGAIASFTISPSISNTPGLGFSTQTGLISGSPTAAAALRTYTITARNIVGTASRTFTIVVRPTPVPFLNTLTNPKMNLKDGKHVCSVGTYEFGYTFDGLADPSVSGVVTPREYTYYLLVNGVADSALTVTTATTSNSWSLTKPSSGSLISCTVAVTVNSLSVSALSTDNTDGLAAAQSAQSAGLKAAEATHKAVAKAIPLAYQKALVDSRAVWRKQTAAIRANYAIVLDRIKSGGGSKMISDTATATEVTNAAKMKANDAYAASKAAAYAEADKAIKAAIEAKTIAIAKAKATYGTYIESIGHGVLIP